MSGRLGAADNNDVGCLRAFGILFDSELDLLPLAQGLETTSLDGRVVNKHVTSRLSLYKAITLVRAELLDSSSYSLTHYPSPFTCIQSFLITTDNLLQMGHPLLLSPPGYAETTTGPGL